MGLVEKRLVMTMERDNFPAWKKLVTEASGGLRIAIEVAWDELVKEKFADSYPKTVEYNFFAPLAQALGQICADDLGKQAVASRLKKIEIGSKRNWSGLKVRFEHDTLYLDADPSYNRTPNDTAKYVNEIRQALESAL